jgi:SAM-dependent MidA family methyltransferase
MSRLRTLIADRIRTEGPISVAEFMRLSLYHPSDGYYARASRRTGRAGDFFTSVDVGPVFGELLARQFAEMWEIVAAGRSPIPDPTPPSFDLVEVGAGSGRLARDVLDALARHRPELSSRVRLHLVEIAAAARAAQVETLGPHASTLMFSSDSLPERVSGVIVANELLDAFPTHAVVMTEEGLREVFIDVRGAAGDDPEFLQCEREPSTPELERYLAAAAVQLEPGWRAEINLEAPAWIRQAARSLQRGFLMLLDYGHEAAELYSASHSAGTLTTFQHHTSGDLASLLQDPGEHDITAHVDLTTVTRTAEAAGLMTLGRLDQTYFLLGLGLAEMLDEPFDPSTSLRVNGERRRTVDLARGRPGDPSTWLRTSRSTLRPGSPDSALLSSVEARRSLERRRPEPGGGGGRIDGEPRRTIDQTALRKRLALKTLMLPGGLGSTLKVLIFGKDVGRPTLRGLSYKVRLT